MWMMSGIVVVEFRVSEMETSGDFREVGRLSKQNVYVFVWFLLELTQGFQVQMMEGSMAPGALV